MIEGLELAKTAATLADDMQAEEIMVLDLKGISSITDYFVICTGTSKPHLKAIQREIREKLKPRSRLAQLLKEAPQLRSDYDRLKRSEASAKAMPRGRNFH